MQEGHEWRGSELPMGSHLDSAWDEDYHCASGWSSGAKKFEIPQGSRLSSSSPCFGSFSGSDIWTNSAANQDESDSWSSMPAAGAASMWSPGGGIQSDKYLSSQPFGGGMSLFYTPKAFRIEEPTDATLSAASTAAATSANRDVEAASSLLSGLSLFPPHPAGPPSVGFESSSCSTLAQGADAGIVPMSTPSPPASFSRGRAWGVQPERLTFDEAPVATRSPGSSTVQAPSSSISSSSSAPRSPATPTAQTPDPSIKLRTIIMRGIPFCATEKDVCDFFSGFTVTRIVFGTCDDGRPNGEAWAVLATMQEAKRAQRMLHKEHLGSRYVELYMSKTPPPVDVSPERSWGVASQAMSPSPSPANKSPSAGGYLQQHFEEESHRNESLRATDEWTEVRGPRGVRPGGVLPHKNSNPPNSSMVLSSPTNGGGSSSKASGGSNTQSGDAKAFACFNCFQTGHISRDCPAPCRVCGANGCSSASHFAEGGAPLDQIAAEAEPKVAPAGLETLTAEERENSNRLREQVAAFLRDKSSVDQGLLGSKFGQKRWSTRVLQRHGGLLAFLRSYPETFTFLQKSQGRASVCLTSSVD